MRSPGTSDKAQGGEIGGLLSTPAALLVLAALLSAALAAFAGVQAAAQVVALPLLPTSVAYDAAGDLYFADTNRHEVYESSLAGVLTVVAGDGVQGFSGDDGAATSAELDSPQGVAVGPDGTLYISDTGNGRVRAVSGGLITTFAGTGSVGFGGDGGAGLTAEFRWPNALAIDASGALLVCDAGNERVRRVSAGVIETIAGDGVQGFAGDGGAATAAELDTPMGIAVGAAGQIYVADSHNNRIRVITADGSISTFAGNGAQGFAGDGGAATAAELAHPRGMMVTAAGAVIFADSNNQRIRMVSAGGTISTIVGSGVQGPTSDGAAAAAAEMDTPRGVAVSSFGSPVYADALNHLVRESVANGDIYVPAGLAPERVTGVTLQVAPSVTYGQTSAAVSVTGGAGTPQGAVELLEGATVAGQTTLAGGAATFTPQTLLAGQHALSATFLGDGVNRAATSATYEVDVAAAALTATANAASVEYGSAVPALTGTLSGVLPQDAGSVTAVFTAAAAPLSPVGSYAIAATLAGPASGNYSVTMSAASGSLEIVKAASVTAEQPLTQGSYAGLPLELTANVTPMTSGMPTGTVQFTQAGTVVATGTLLNGVATATYISPPAGAISIVASYAGDGNFSASSSQATTATVSAVPGFTMASTGSTTQTVGAGEVATYTMTIGAQSGAFTGVVDMSASGLPPQATVSFSPPQVVPGASSATVTMSVQTSAILPADTMLRRYGGVALALSIFPWLLFGLRKRGAVRSIALCSLLLLMMGATGCGARSISSSALGGQTYTLTVTATSTNLAGAVVSHSMNVTLVVD